MAEEAKKEEEEQIEFEVEQEEDTPAAEDKPRGKAKDDEPDVEVVDDTPEEDRGRRKADPPEDVTDDELEQYSEKVQKRIKHFTKGYHDERRARETAERERQALEDYARKILEENKKLKGTVGKSHESLIGQAKRSAELEYEKAQRAYKEAYESGDADAMVKAQDELTRAGIRLDKVTSYRPPARQEDGDGVQPTEREQESPRQKEAPVDPRAKRWAEENPWFGQDDEMTSFAFGLHNKLVKEGVNPRQDPDTYYERLNTRMREVFPNAFEEEPGTKRGERKRSGGDTVVAPATRSTAPKKIVLTKSQVSIAKRLGVPLEEYAKQVADLRKQNNG